MNQCQGETKDGLQCTRLTDNAYCWQHADQEEEDEDDTMLALRCSFQGCSLQIVKGSNDCGQHNQCRFLVGRKPCGMTLQQGLTQCVSHTSTAMQNKKAMVVCSKGGCRQVVLGGATLCGMHQVLCATNGCGKYIVSGSTWCSEHQTGCPFILTNGTRCGAKNKPTHEECTRHRKTRTGLLACSNQGCALLGQTETTSGFCKQHEKKMCPCLNEDGSNCQRDVSKSGRCVIHDAIDCQTRYKFYTQQQQNEQKQLCGPQGCSMKKDCRQKKTCS